MNDVSIKIQILNSFSYELFHIKRIHIMFYFVIAMFLNNCV